MKEKRQTINSPPIWGTNIDTVVILGAGASKNYQPFESEKKRRPDFPLDSNFFQKARKELKRFPELNAFIEYIYPDPYGSKRPGLEEVFTLIETYQRWFQFAKDSEVHRDIDKSISRFFPPLPYLPFTSWLDREWNPWNKEEFPRGFPNAYFGYDTSKLVNNQRRLVSSVNEGKKGNVVEGYSLLQVSFEAVKNQIKRLVYCVFAKEHERHNKKAGKCVPCELHTKLFNSIIVDPANKGLAVVSFNYDLVGDSSLSSSLKETQGWEWNAETFYFQLFSPTPMVIRRPDVERNKNIFLLKLHGSLNWFQPVKDSRQFICGEIVEEGPRILSEQELFERDLNPVIIPPMMDKFMELEREGEAGHHGRSWTVALDSLLKAKKWIFIGYSLPPTDFHASWLFKTAASYRKSISDIPEVDIVDPCNRTNLRKLIEQYGLSVGKTAENLARYLEAIPPKG